MRTLLFHGFAILLLTHILGCATTGTSNTRNLAAENDQKLHQLIEKFKRDKNSVSYAELWRAYLQSSQVKNLATQAQGYHQALKALQSGEKSCGDINWQALIKQNYWAIEPHLSAADCYEKIGDTNKAQFHHDFVSFIIDGVIASGDGQHYYGAFEAASWQDIEAIASIAGFKIIDRYLELIAARQGFYYVLIAEDENGKQRKIYFDNMEFMAKSLGYPDRFADAKNPLGEILVKEMASVSAPVAIALGEMLQADKEYKLAGEWYLKASLGETAQAYFKLVSLCLSDRAPQFDAPTCLEFASKAAELGSAEAYVVLSGLYREGIWVTKDMKLAQDFFTIAVEKLPEGDAENMLAEIYEAGLLGKDNQQKALHWYRKGYAKGSAAPSYIEYLKTQTIEHNNRSAAKRLIALADQNNAVAQLYLGAQAALKKENRNRLLAIGEAKQIEHLKRAAEAGLPRAQYLLSIMSRHGIGVKKDNKRALNLLKMAARNWHPDAQLEYGRHLHRNVMSLLTKLENANFTGFNAAFAVVKALEQRAYRFIHSAAIQGSLGALMSAGVMIREGIGVEADPDLAVKYFKVAAESGHAGGAYFYALSFFRGQGVEKDYQQALHWFTKSADAGDEDSAYYLGLMYRDGIGLASNVAKAVEWFTKGADNGSEEAAIALGDYYSDGKFSKPNLAEAQKWYQKAAAKGNKEATQKLQRLKQEI